MPQFGNPTPPLVGGNSVQSLLQGYVFQSGIHMPEHSSILTYKYPQYYLTTLLDRMGAEEGESQDIFSWNIMDRTREGSTFIAIDTTLPAASVVADTDFDYTADKKGYLLVGDLLRVESGAILRVTATQDNGSGKQEVTLVNQAGGNITATDLQADDAFGHIANVFGEASSAPGVRNYLPVEEFNTLGILRRSYDVSGSELTNKIWLDGDSWFFEKEDIEMKEFTRDQEGFLMFGTINAASPRTQPTATKGLWTYAESDGVENFFAAASGVSETDIQDHVRDLMLQNVSNEIYVLCGAQFLVDFQRAMKEYAVGGAMDYGRLGANVAGLDFHEYKFIGKSVKIAYYELFDDPSMVPTPVNGIDQASRTDFSNASLWVDFGTDGNGRSLITKKFKELNGMSRKFIHKYVNGLVDVNGSTTGQAANGDDKFTGHFLAHIGLEVRLPNRLGILRAGS